MTSRLAKLLPWVAAIVLAGCADPAEPILPVRHSPSTPQMAPLTALQQKAYAETATGRFVGLADFEDILNPRLTADKVAQHGYEQLRYFQAAGTKGSRMRHVVNITRTGAGAMEVTLPPGASLVFRTPYIHDFSKYLLLSMAVYCPGVRDDLVVTLSGRQGKWRSMRRLTPAGWNTVMVDLARLARTGKFDLQNVETIELQFTASEEPVRFNLDDIMLIDNHRRIANTPAGVELIKAGLDYSLTLPGWPAPLQLAQSEDGLWRVGDQQLRMRVAEKGQDLRAADVGLRALGRRRIGSVELIETNAVRLRIRNTWYFPPQAGEWIDLDVQRVRWEYTFYADGRWVTAVTINNAGGAELGGVSLRAPRSVAWCTGAIGPKLTEPEFTGPVGQWALLAAPPGPSAAAYLANYSRPATMAVRLGHVGGQGSMLTHDGFDRAEGCYVTRATGGNCRIELRPNGSPLLRPVIRVVGSWKGKVAANCDALPLPNVTPVADGVVAIVPDSLTTPAVVELTGPVAAGQN